ncbi:hypothetical protein LPB260_24305 [Pseudomonas sp. LPB0260]|uniref:hypothetical protein n=1 Tax=Pseudomonas sp. LPB0260 TaxID=2614442 RepID=UPI0015C28C2C|nr:hypothetical protein [Pseudomonas sp. LPB0260]QLC73833.1 hypothetical protein LPB260_09355 [Pseudomonas sp. LPB0260]QLC76607.1 hypothetical protein LPB260_24305 [Pseudomonas sp. LPB0260]
MKLLKPIFVVVALYGAATLLYPTLPLHYQHAISDWHARLGTPTYSEAPDYFSARDQAAVISENEARGHKLKCYGNLGPAERISAQDDYLCSAHISNAYDNIPARLVTFFFSKNKLSNVRIEFASGSFDRLNDYLMRKLADYPRLDKMPGARFGTDSFGKKLVVWRVKHGLITAAAEDTPGQNPIILWSGYRYHSDKVSRNPPVAAVTHRTQ